MSVRSARFNRRGETIGPKINTTCESCPSPGFIRAKPLARLYLHTSSISIPERVGTSRVSTYTSPSETLPFTERHDWTPELGDQKRRGKAEDWCRLETSWHGK